MMCLNGGYNLGCTKTMTLLIVFGMTHFTQVFFSVAMMSLGIGIMSTIKVLLRYPAIVAHAMALGLVYAPLNYESRCYISRRHGDEIQLHAYLSLANNIFSFVRVIIVFCLPKNLDAIVTVSKDGTNIAFGLHLSAKEINIISIVFFIIGAVAVRAQEFYYGTLLTKRKRKRDQVTKALKLKSLDIFKDEETDDEDQVLEAESTYL